MSGFWQSLNIIGGLGLFLFGMRIMSDGIHKRAGLRMQKILGFLTKNRFLGVFFGFAVTGIIQSSSATTVLLVSLVNAGLLSLQQSIGVIMGANIGTTVTAWFVSIVGFKFQISAIALPAIAIGLPLHFSKKEKFREISEVLIGFGILFLGLDIMKSNVPDISSNPDMLHFLTSFCNYGYFSVLLFVLIGTVLAVVVQSSSAAMAITLTLAYRGWIPFPIAAAIVLGENIGTTITAYLASSGMSVNARRAARAHMLFNIIGVCWVLVLFYPFLNLVNFIIPGQMDDPLAMPIHLSAFHTIFNASNTLLLIGFVPLIERLSKFLVKDESPDDNVIELKFISSNFPDAIETNLITSRKAIARMADKVYDMMTNLVNNYDKPEKLLIEVSAVEDYTDKVQHELTEFLISCINEVSSQADADLILSQQRITNELERIADACYTITLIFCRIERKGLDFHKGGIDQIKRFISFVLEYLKYNSDYLNYRIVEYDLEQAFEMEDKIDKKRRKLRRSSQDSLYEGADVRGELAFMDIIKYIEHIGDYCLNIAQAIKHIDTIVRK